MTQFRSATVEWAAAGESSANAAKQARRIATEAGLRMIAFVEGVSDRVAVETLAGRRGHDLDADGVCVLPIGGATSIGRFIDLIGPTGLDVELAGMCDAGEERHFWKALERAGLAENPTRTELEAIGFFVCVADLEEELIRALGSDTVKRVIEQQGDLRSFLSLQRQPAQRDSTVERQLWRFMGSIGGRKERYARALVMELTDAQTPRPLELLVAHLGRRPTS